MGENQNNDTTEYTLLSNEMNSNELDFKINENRNNTNYIDKVGFLAVGHDKAREVGVTSNGVIFTYDKKKMKSLIAKEDSLIYLSANDSLFVNFENIEVNENTEIYLEFTSRLNNNNKALPDGKGDTTIGDIAHRTESNIIDIVGIHESPNTTFTLIPPENYESENDSIFITPSRSIVISSLNLMIIDNNKTGDCEIASCKLREAQSANKDITENVFRNDEEYHIFGINEGFSFSFSKPDIKHPEIDYIL